MADTALPKADNMSASVVLDEDHHDTTTTSLEEMDHESINEAELPSLSQNRGLTWTYMWSMVGAGVLVSANVWGLPLSYGLFEDYYALDLLPPGTSPAKIAWIGTVQNFLVVILGLAAGPLYDMGHFPVLMIVGPVLNVLGAMMISLSTNYWQLFLSHACSGLGAGMLYVPLLALVTRVHGKETVALAQGLVAAGNGIGGVVFTVVFARLQPQIGFPWTVRIMAFLMLFGFIVAVPILLAGPYPRRGGRARALIDTAALKEKEFWSFAWGLMFGFQGYLPFIFYIPIYAQVRLHVNQATANYLLVGAQGGSTLGRIAAGIAATRCGTLNSWIFCVFASGVLSLAWIAVHDIGGFAPLAILFGFFTGPLTALPSSLMPSITPDLSMIGTRFGMAWAVVSIATLSGGPSVGALINLQTADFVGLQVWGGAWLLAAGVLLSGLWYILYQKRRTILI